MHAHTPQPYLSVPGLRKLNLPSPLHLKLHVLTRLSFNEQGRITRHRDFWDVRDVIGLVPGMTVAQWIGTRVAGHGISIATQFASWLFGRRKAEESADCERGRLLGSSVSSQGDATPNALGLELNVVGQRRTTWGSSQHSHHQREREVVAQAPDVDRDSGS
jgi:hypothetical protein